MSHRALHRLAVYGTLGPGRSNHHQVEMIRGEWTTGFVRGHLFNQGWGAQQGFPGLVLGDGDQIRVDVLHSSELPQHWERLDAFEGEGYRRAVATIDTESGVVEACIYVLVQR